MAGVERFLSRRLKLVLNREKSRVAGSWMCDYLDYGMSWH
jgi:RNA-directed DNA polymerase